MAWNGGSGVALVHPRLTNRGRAAINRILRTAGWKEEQFWVCRPDDVPVEARALVAMGDEAQVKLTGWSGGKRATKYTRGYELPSWTGRPVVPTLDPEMVAQGNWKLLSLMMHDVGVALGAACGRGGVVHDPKGMVDYKEGVGALRALVQTAKADPSLLVAFDLETRGSEQEDEDETIEFSRDTDESDGEEADEDPGGGAEAGIVSDSRGGFTRSALDINRATITTVQFSVGPGTGVSTEWGSEVRELTCELMRLQNQKAGHNCFYRGTKVWMANGTWKNINSIQTGEYVRTLDSTGLLVNRRVTDTSHTIDNRKWVEVKVDGGYKRGTGRWGNPGVICTEDHKWILADGSKVEAQDLKIGDKIHVPWQGNEDILEGSILGDGHMSASQAGRFRCGHTNKEWAQAKATSFGVSLCKEIISTGYKPGTEIYTFSAQVPHCNRKFYYREDGTRKWLAPSLRGMAIWYGDDGSLSTKGYATISIYKYPDAIDRIQGWFAGEFGPTSISKDGGILRLSAEASRNFYEKIAPLLHPSMQYKIPPKYRGRYCGWMERTETLIGRVESVESVDKGSKWDKHKYCLTVDETHTFFTRMGLTKNSWLFDRPILLNHDVPVPIETDDTMWMWHHLQPDLPAHLQGVASLWRFPFPWKHMAGSDLTFYGAADVDAVQWIMRGLPRDMKRLGIWDGYLRYVRAFRPILEEMERRGIPVSREKLAELREWLKIEVDKMDGRLQVVIPQEICLPEKKEPYAGIPNDAKAAIKLVHPAIAGLAKAKQGAVLKTLGLDDPIVRDCILAKGYGIRDGKVWKEDRQPFNPRSPLQILSYLRHQNYAIPKRFRDGKDSTADKELERLEVKTGDEVIKLTRGIRAYSKMSNGYAGKVGKDGQVEGGWYPGGDGRLRATFGFGPATGQLAARNPNVLTTPKRRPELAKKFRECIVAPPGHKLIECLHPTTRILTEDYRWIPIGNLLPGDIVWGFDEEPIQKEGAGRSGRYLRRSEVLSVSLLTKPSIKITTNFGEVICSGDHFWLSRQLGKARWTEANKLKVGDSISYFVRPWEYDSSREAGYLAGFLDGEGYLTNAHRVGFGQNPGPTLDGVLDLLTKKGWTHCDSTGTAEKWSEINGGKVLSKCRKIDLAGEQFIWLRFLGSIRPPRLLSKVDLEGKAYWGKRSKSAIILAIEEVGDQEVVAMETTTHTFIAEGMLSHNCDMRAFHARTTGLAAESADYMRLADMDIHSFLAGHLVHYPGIETCLTMSDDDLRPYLAEIKKAHKAVRDFKAKPTILGVGFKMGHRRLYFENRDSLADEREAKHLLDTLKNLFPDVFKWQDAICEEADRKHHLINSWGGMRWFWDVFKWQRVDGEWRRSSSKDAEKVVAYLPSSNAHYMLRDKLLQMQRVGWLDLYGLVNVIHDAVLFVCPDRLVEECVHNVKGCLEAPVMELAHPTLCPEGFTCAAEASVGDDWARMEEIK